MGALDELLAKWRENPDSGTTLALCTYLGTSRREELVREVGATSEAWHKDDPQVMLAVGRMYLDAGLLQESQAALVAAGKGMPNDGTPYRYLGEVLLRRGDATRAEKVLARALQLGASEGDTRMWHDRALVYAPLQKRVGMQAVADEVERTIPRKNSIPPPMLSPGDAERLARFGPAVRASTVPPPPGPRLPHFSEEEIPTGRFSPEELLAAHSAIQEDVSTAVMSLSDLPSSTRTDPPPAQVRLPPVPRTPAPPPRSSAPPPPVPAAPAAPVLQQRARPSLAQPRAPSAPAPVAQAPVRAAPAPVRAAPAPARAAPAPARAASKGSLSGEFDDSPRPSPETVLEHLARVGVFERGGGASPAWVTPARERPRGTWVFVAAILLAAGAGYGAFAYTHKVRTERMATARRLEGEAKKLLGTARVDDLKKTDEKLSSVFELDSRSQVAALLWLENRVLSALLLPGEPRGIESALARCKTLNIDEAKTAFGKLTSFLAEGDLAGAAGVLPKWDDKAKEDPLYQLAAGALLERAGDARAIGRYEQAFKLDPALLPARAFHAALAALELGIAAARPSLDEAAQLLGDAPAARALRGLAWALDPAAPETLPDDARLDDAARERLPAQFLALPGVVDARAAARAGHMDDALEKLGKALRLTATPSLAAFIGQVAIELGDEQLARQATLRALSYSALYPKARALAARVALLGARLDEAKKAVQELDAQNPEVAVVRAAAAYEILDLSELESALPAVGEGSDAAKALGHSMEIALGQKLPPAADLLAMAVPSVPWGDLVAVDAALDQGDLQTANTIVTKWGERATTPTYALRRARLLRYQGRAEDAVKASGDAVVPGGVTARVLVERFECLLAHEEIKPARDFLAQYPAVLGPMTDYLKVTLDVADGKAARAKVAAARLEPLGEGSPVLYEIFAIEALARVGDKRGKPLATALLKRLPTHPDVVAIGKAVGIVK